MVEYDRDPTKSPALPIINPPERTFGPAEKLHENPFETVYAVHADFKTHTKDYYVVDFGPSAGVVVVRDNHVLLTAQYRYLVDKVVWEVPGGCVDPGESFVDAARRECLEETGVLCQDLKPLITFRNGLDNVENLTQVFYCETPEIVNEFTPDPKESLDIAWVPLEDCVSLALSWKLEDAVTVASILGYCCLLDRKS